MKLYKLTDENGRTYGETQWGPGITHSGTGEGALCGPGWIHAYTDPLLAVFLNHVHAKFKSPRLWEGEGDISLTDYGLKVGCKTFTTVREMPLPVVTTEQRIRFGILCVKQVSKEKQWNTWADAWLSGQDRSAAVAWTAAEDAMAEAEAAAAAAAHWAEVTAAAAAHWAAHWAADAASYTTRAWPEWSAAYGVAKAVENAAEAAEYAASARTALDLVALAHQAIEGGE